MSHRGDHDLAASLAEGAGRLLANLHRTSPDEVARGRLESRTYLGRRLDEERPADAVLSEETEDDPARLAAERVWILEPLDGTREFGEHRDDHAWRTDFAVQVALWRREGGVTAAAVALPGRHLLYRSDTVSPPPRSRRRGALRIAVSRSRPPALLESLARELPLEVVPMGSTGAKAMAVVTGEVDLYLHVGGLYEWHSAAAVAVAKAAGLHTSRIDGSRLTYNRGSTWLPDLLICRRELAATLLGQLHRLQESR